MTRGAADRSVDGYKMFFADARLGRSSVPRLQLLAWRNALSQATTIADVTEVVQRIVRVRHAAAAALPSSWQPRKIHSREDIEHWARRILSRPAGPPPVPGLVPLGHLMHFALERMNELGPKRGFTG